MAYRQLQNRYGPSYTRALIVAIAELHRALAKRGGLAANPPRFST
jgi:hypothetical protein